MSVIKLDIIDNSAIMLKQNELNIDTDRKLYSGAVPFPHIIFDDFLPLPIIRRISEEFGGEKSTTSYQRKQELNKTSFNPDKDMSLFCRSAFHAFNSRYFIEWLEKLTGIEGLIPDPYFNGGGFHETRPGGYLNIHADFNIHKRLNLLRRINVLIYLNEDWPDHYGGNLEFWDKNMMRAEKIVEPTLNRCVIFNTTKNSYHGHPTPLSCPENRSRRSIALYYYTASPAIYDLHPTQTTNFKARPNSNDKSDIKVAFFDILRDLSPPIVTRLATKFFRNKT